MNGKRLWWISLSLLIALSIYAIIGEGKQRDVVAAGVVPPVRPVLILDAGHGGEDGGAVSRQGLRESVVNLDIVLRMRDLAGFFGVETVLTRRSEEIVYPPEATTTARRKRWDTRERVALINSVDNGLLLSVHQNMYPDSRPHGPQVFYAGRGGDAAFARLTHANLTEQLLPESRRVAAPADPKIYIMAHAECPSVLAECGFLSHPAEAVKLGSGEYRLKLAVILLASYLEYTGENNESENDLLLHGVR